MPISTTLKYRGYNSYKLDVGETLHSEKFDVSMFNDLVSQVSAIWLGGTPPSDALIQVSYTFFDETDTAINPSYFWSFRANNRWSDFWETRAVPANAHTLRWSVSTAYSNVYIATPKVSGGTMPTAFSDDATHRNSYLNAEGLYTSTVSANQVIAGILRAISGNAWFDLEEPEIVMQGDDGTVLKSSPDNPLRIENDDGDLVGGLTLLDGVLKLIAGAISNDEAAKTYLEVGKMPDENNIERDGIRIVNELLNKPVLEMPIGGSGDSRELLLKLLSEKWLKLYMLGSEYGNQTVWLDLGPGHFWARKSTPGDDFIQITAGSGSGDKPELYIGENDVRIAFFDTGVGQNALGIDGTGPYLTKAGAKTYFGSEPVLLKDSVTLSSSGSTTFTDVDEHNLYMVMGYDSAGGITAWHSCVIPASASSIRYAHRMHNDTMPFTLVRSGTTCTLKREGTTAITYKVYGIA